MKYQRWGLAVAVVVFILYSWCNIDAMARELAIISNKDYPLNTITVDKVKQIYLGEKMIEGNVKIRPMEHNDEEIKRKFIERVMGSSIDGYKAYWIKKFFQEGVTPPINKASSTELINAVSNTSGGIGYVWIEDARAENDIKVLLKINVGD